MMDEVDVAQARLNGRCEICDGVLPIHKMGCPQLHRYYGQFGIKSSDDLKRYKSMQTIHHQLDLFEDYKK